MPEPVIAAPQAVPALQPAAVPTVRQVYLPKLNQIATFPDSEFLKIGAPTVELHVPPTPLPKPALPLDWAKSLSFPINGNDIYGDCMMAAAEHADNTFTGNTGTESSFSQSFTVTEYLRLAGGNNGLNSGQIISAWKNGLPGVPPATIMEALSIDTTNADLVQTAIWLFGGVFFTLKIPDNWYNDFYTGGTWDAPAKSDSKNGHGVWWNGIAANGNYKLQTWGTYGWITPAGVKDCDPGGFVVFSMRWFNAHGVAPNGFSYNDLASYWNKMGGSSLPYWPAASTQVGRLLTGQGLLAGQFLKSADGRFQLLMQTDGNLVLHGPGFQVLWDSGTSGHPDIWGAVMQSDGNFVVYDAQNQALWSSHTNGKDGATLTLQNDGNLVVYDAQNHAAWASNTAVPGEPPVPTQPGRLLSGQGLMAGKFLLSQDGRFRLLLQLDGNLVLYGPTGVSLWASGSSGHNNVWDVVMQADGNLVIADGHSHAVWASKTNGKNGATLTVQNDGNVVIYDTGNHAVWASNTVVPATPAAPNQVGRLLPGQGLMAGKSLKSADGRFTFLMQADGNLVLYGPGSQVMWSSKTNGKEDIWDVIMQTDGNLVLYDAHSHVLWESKTNGKNGATLTVQNDGNVVIYDATGHAVWATDTVVPPPTPVSTQAGKLLPGQGLMVGGALSSTDGRFTLRMQSDGNLVLYDPYNQALWSSKTNGHEDAWSVVMQADGNFVMGDIHGKAIWSSNTHGKNGASLTVQTDGNVVIYDTANKAVWATNTEVGVEILKG